MPPRKKQDVRKAVGYVRVSTSDQAEHGVSLDAQRDRIEAYAKAQGLELTDIFEDHISGASTNGRHGLEKAMTTACKHKAVLMVFALTRFARSTRDAIDLAERLEKQGADLASLSEHIDTSSSMGRFVFRLFASLGELERDQISERTKVAMAHRRKQGRHVSRFAPFGWDLTDGRELVRNPREQRWLKFMIQKRDAGWSMYAIAKELNRRHVRTKRGGACWRGGMVKAMIRRAECVGQ